MVGQSKFVGFGGAGIGPPNRQTQDNSSNCKARVFAHGNLSGIDRGEAVSGRASSRRDANHIALLDCDPARSALSVSVRQQESKAGISRNLDHAAAIPFWA